MAKKGIGIPITFNEVKVGLTKEAIAELLKPLPKPKPSGIILTWLGDDGKIHTKSIMLRGAFQPLEMAKLNAKTELFLLQYCFCYN